MPCSTPANEKALELRHPRAGFPQFSVCDERVPRTPPPKTGEAGPEESSCSSRTLLTLVHKESLSSTAVRLKHVFRDGNVNIGVSISAPEQSHLLPGWLIP